jgi:hypothetical protein
MFIELIELIFSLLLSMGLVGLLWFMIWHVLLRHNKLFHVLATGKLLFEQSKERKKIK